MIVTATVKIDGREMVSLDHSSEYGQFGGLSFEPSIGLEVATEAAMFRAIADIMLGARAMSPSQAKGASAFLLEADVHFNQAFEAVKKVRALVNGELETEDTKYADLLDADPD